MDDKEKTVTFPTAGFPIVYANHVSAAMSPVDIRIYLHDVGPKDLDVESTGVMNVREALLQPRICLVLTPEFARIVRDSLAGIVNQFELKFGPLRQVPGLGPEEKRTRK